MTNLFNFNDYQKESNQNSLSPFQVKGLLEGLVNVIVTDEKKKLVNMEELHAAMKINTRFNDWIARRIENVGFIENQDFYSVLSKSANGRPKTEYYFLLDCAKEVALMENNEMGKKFRKYFIEMEKVATRFLGKITRRSLTEAIRDNWHPSDSYIYGKATNELVYKQVFNRSAKQIAQERNIEGNIRDALPKEELLLIEEVEQEAAKFIDDYGLKYEEVLKLLNKKYRMKLLLSKKLLH